MSPAACPLLLLLLCACATARDGPLAAYVARGADGRLAVSYAETPLDAAWGDGRNLTASASFENSINSTGWAVLGVQTNEALADELQAYSVGLLEGFLTADLIHMYWWNTMRGFCDGREEVCARVQDYLRTNQRWVEDMVANHSSTQAYWHQVDLIYKQLKGVADGYASKNQDPSKVLSYNDILWLNLQGDLEDLLDAVDPASWLEEPAAVRGGRVPGAGSCSALVKILPDGSDLFVAHDTWSSLQSMLRVLKKYDFGYRAVNGSGEVVPGRSISFSSYPGVILSNDDFYVTSAGLVTQETTIGNSDSTRWQFVRPEGQVLEFVRTMVANRLAHSGRSWTKTFGMYNSGTYNNQWMVVDYKRFWPFQPPAQQKKGLLWVLEQIPGYVEAADKTDVLRKQSYWPSYNSPYFPTVFNMSGLPKLVQKYGSWYSYDHTPRALIFRRDHHKVANMSTMLDLMRYNNYLREPLSKCACEPRHNAENTIACRSDLNPANGTYPFPALGHRSHVATDSKATSRALAKDLRFVAVSGPPHGHGVPVFQWNTSDFRDDTPHLGQPEYWDFKPVTIKWD
ncbi:putative phospholipase B-like 2 [Bacillus rossius redtenbacheri]|uniref:putative phospholipase B-like 2 n=1 Tax=Bacillus rossius redtenbacheri TaxID=93214 RepID=UPI002FDEAD38